VNTRRIVSTRLIGTRSLRLILTTASMSLVGIATPALAEQQANDPTSDQARHIEEIVVTARKREESLVAVPDSLQVLTGDDLEKKGLTSTYDVASSVPGLSWAIQDRESNISIRGVSSNLRTIGTDPSTATYFDDVYLPRSNMVLAEIFDLRQIEILKGPQGTLYGRNANGGVVNIRSNAPTDEYETTAVLATGSNDLIRFQGSVNVPFRRGAFRLSGAYADDDGYTKQVFAGGPKELDARDVAAVRGRLRYELSDAWTATASVHFQDDKGSVGYGSSGNVAAGTQALLDDGSGRVLTYGDPAANRIEPFAVRINDKQGASRQSTIASIVFDGKIGGLGFKSITGATRYRSSDAQDTDRSSFPGDAQTTTSNSDAVSQEFQLHDVAADRLEWTAGTYLFKEEADENGIFFDARTLAQFSNREADAVNEALGVFAQGTYELTDRFSMLAGARYTAEDKHADVRRPDRGTRFSGDLDYGNTTYKAQLIYQPSERLTAYLGVATGFKSGGINTQARTLDTFDPENVTAYEVGFKTDDLLETGTYLNVVVFYNDYQDIQLRRFRFDSDGVTPIVEIDNGGSAETYGAELSLAAPLGAYFSLDANVGYLHSEIHDFINSRGIDFEGSVLPLSPESGGAVGLEFEPNLSTRGFLRSRVEVTWTTQVLFPQLSNPLLERAGGHTLLNASIRYTTAGEKMYVELSGRNLTDKTYVTNRIDFLPSVLEEQFGAPRSYEARIGFRF
jgi:iron complex outermembrane recepter protein